MTRSVSYGTSVTMSFAGNRLRDVADPTAAQDAATKNYVDSAAPSNSFAAPSFTLSTSAAQGSSTSLVRSNATIIAFDVTAPTTQAFGDSAATGSAAVAARRDHKHAMPADPFTGTTAGGDLSGAYPNPSIAASKVTEAKLSLADSTTYDVSTSRHGFVPKAPNDATKYLDGTGAFSTPAGTGTTVKAARVYNSAATSIADSTATALPFDTEDFDTDTIHSTSSNTSRLTCVTAGKYIIQAQVEWAASATGVRTIQIRLNGTTVIASNRKLSLSTGVTQMLVETLYSLAVTDYVEVLVTQTSGLALNVDQGSGTTWFGMVGQAVQGAAGAAGATGAAGANGTGVKLYDYEVTGSDKASIDTAVDGTTVANFSGYDILEVWFYHRVDEAVPIASIDLFFNNDTAGNYEVERLRAVNTTLSGTPANARAGLLILGAGASDTASVFTVTRMSIPNYLGTVGFKSCEIVSGMADATAGNKDVTVYAGLWKSTVAISRIKLAPNTALKKFLVGSRLLVYGR